MYRGDKIYFRTLTNDDVSLMMAWENNPENWKISSTIAPYSREQIEEFVNLNQDIFIHSQLRLIICLTETNDVIGNIDLFDFEPEHKRIGVGILIDENYRNKGLANQSIELIEEYCKIILDVKNLFCNILTDNIKSISLFEKNEFKRVCIKPNWHQYKGEWFDEYLYLKAI
jgi:diamine N-acetyltransferase